MNPAGSRAETDPATIANELEHQAKRARCQMVRRWRNRGLSIDQLDLLLVLQVEGPASISRIAELRGVAQSNASFMVSRLAQQQLVAKEPAPGDDKRRVQVTLTKAGEELLAELQFARRRHVVAVLEAMTAEERAEFRRAFQRFFELARTVVPSGTRAEPPRSADEAGARP
jgi:DNA-binding MarR family transcriptional regulator